MTRAGHATDDRPLPATKGVTFVHPAWDIRHCRAAVRGSRLVTSPQGATTMPPILSSIVLVIAVITFAAIVIDTLTSGDRRGGLPAASFTYRAYGA
jgi:hypothetical protein